MDVGHVSRQPGTSRQWQMTRNDEACIADQLNRVVGHPLLAEPTSQDVSKFRNFFFFVRPPAVLEILFLFLFENTSRRWVGGESVGASPTLSA